MKNTVGMIFNNRLVIFMEWVNHAFKSIFYKECDA